MERRGLPIAAGLFHLDIEKTILTLCLERGAGKTICPSEVARALQSDDAAWRALMPKVREVAHEMAKTGDIAIYHKGKQRPDHDVTGVIRLGLPHV